MIRMLKLLWEVVHTDLEATGVLDHTLDHYLLLQQVIWYSHMHVNYSIELLHYQLLHSKWYM